jgi:hypothetical protein
MKLPAVFLFLSSLAFGIGQTPYVERSASAGSFAVVRGGVAAGVYVDSHDDPGVRRAVNDLRGDIERVAGAKSAALGEQRTGAILVGTLGKSAAIDALVKAGQIDARAIAGKWESFVIQTVGNNLVIAGSDRRGTIYGVYDLCEQMGVSPWTFWADVPVRHRDAVYVKAGKYVEGPPAVKYRGIFLNDEAPALSGWVKDKYGKYNHEFYEKVFELILRMKGNYLWPAMWGSAFNEDDAESPRIADEWGVVMGTTHHEPMLRAQQEWKRHGTGPWDYTKNADILRAFWREGVRRNKAYESIISIGMRGDGDMPMARGEANIPLLEQIVAEQRKILADELNPDPAKIPQLWALYKEVQDYYDKGMRVPDDVTLLWSDDNWGNIRRLPTAEERKRSGGAGVYYHFDYVGGPRNYKWIDTNPIPKVWEQMTMAKEYGADRIWIVNIGDLKPMEFPTEFFLHLAWDPARWPKERLGDYTRLWAEREFGAENAGEIADLVSKGLKYNARRKPELLEPDTYSVVNYGEADRVVAEYQEVVRRAEAISEKLPSNARDAFFELVTHPAKANAIVTELYVTVAKNRLAAAQGRASTNDYAAKARALYQADADLTKYFNQTLAGGKWSHMMDQTHIGYTYWQEPRTNSMPAVKEIEVPEVGAIGADVVELSFDGYNRPQRQVELFNRGKAPVQWTAKASAAWIVLGASRGTVEKETRVPVTIDWAKAPQGGSTGTIEIAGGGEAMKVAVQVSNAAAPGRDKLAGFVETDGYVSIEAEHFTRLTGAAAARWERIPDYGRTLSAMTIAPVTAPSATPPNAPCLEYRMWLVDPAKVEVEAILAPTLNIVPGRGLRYAIAFDDQAPQMVDALAKNSQRDWETTVKDAVRKVKSSHTVSGTGYHTLKFWMIDPGVVLEKLVVDLGGAKPSYLGPPESYHRGE